VSKCEQCLSCLPSQETRYGLRLATTSPHTVGRAETLTSIPFPSFPSSFPSLPLPYPALPCPALPYTTLHYHPQPYLAGHIPLDAVGRGKDLIDKERKRAGRILHVCHVRCGSRHGLLGCAAHEREGTNRPRPDICCLPYGKPRPMSWACQSLPSPWDSHRTTGRSNHGTGPKKYDLPECPRSWYGNTLGWHDVVNLEC
jgi:hypothetical protein